MFSNEPYVRKNSFWADAINSVLLRPVYRVPTGQQCLDLLNAVPDRGIIVVNGIGYKKFGTNPYNEFYQYETNEYIPLGALVSYMQGGNYDLNPKDVGK